MCLGLRACTVGGEGGGCSSKDQMVESETKPYPQRAHISMLLGPKTLLCKAFGLF